jgi:ssDNA-binding replication factor A large subunit
MVIKLEGECHLPYFKSFRLTDIFKINNYYCYTFNRLITVKDEEYTVNTRRDTIKVYSNNILDEDGIKKEIKRSYPEYFI